MFLNTLGISKQIIDTAFKKIKNEQVDLIDKRGMSKLKPKTVDVNVTKA